MDIRCGNKQGTDERSLVQWLRAAAAYGRSRLRRGVVFVLAILIGLIAFQGLRTRDLERQLGREQAHVAALADGLRRMRGEALTRDEIDVLRTELRHGLADAGARVRALEAGSAAGSQVVAQASGSVVLLQGSYGLRDPVTQRPLRLAVANGQPMRRPDGRPMFTLQGKGPPFEVRFTGTAFVVNQEGALLTNRHVALPWESEMSLPGLRVLGLEPVMFRLRGYLPGVQQSFDLKLLAVSDTHDLALLRGEGAALAATPLRLASGPAAPGETAIVLGYPAGVRALLARAGEAFTNEMRGRADSMDDEVVALELARAGLVHPLASRGIVAQVTREAVVYDAQTSVGGSGGPVLDANGEVVAINRAMLAGFGGSNLGVPARYAVALLRQADEAANKVAAGVQR